MAYTEHTHCPNCFKPSFKAVCPGCFFDRNTYLQQEAASHHLPLFTVLDKGYVLGRVLGEGSFAIVYAAIREKDLLPCAVKEYYPHDLAQRGLDGKTVNPKRNQEQLATWQNRFIQEGELLRCCYDYPSVEFGVVRYMAMVKQHGTAYLVMERLSGDNLGHYLTPNKSVSGETICLWLKPLLETLQKLHAKEIYHRDISPNNIFLCAPDNPVLMDFGLAREGARDEILKSSTLGAGTFIAPEQLTGGYCDQRTDLYALGAVIYLCLHGEAPPPVEARRQGAPLKRLPQPDNVSLALQTVAAHCLQLDLQARPQNAAQILTELASCWVSQASLSSASMRTIIPDQAYPPPPGSQQTRANPSVVEQLPPNPAESEPPTAGHFKNTVKLLFWAGLAYGGFMLYQNYTAEQEKISKQERRLFAKAQSIADFKSYLEQCQICEAKQEASDNIAKLEQQQKKKQEQQQKKKQEHLTYIQAQTIEDLRAYLVNCEFCLDKKKAEAELKQKLEEQDRAKAKESLGTNILNAVTQPILDSAIQVLEEAKNSDDDAEAKTEAQEQAQAEAQAKEKEEADAKAQAQEKLKAELEEAIRQGEAEKRAKAQAEEKAKAEEKLKSEVENSIKQSTGIDVKEIQNWLDTHSK